MTHQHHQFHIVDQSPWPLTASMGAFSLLLGITFFIHYKSMSMMLFSLIILIMTSYQWWRDISRESTFQGHHTIMVTNGLKIGMLLFIVSEIMFFLSFFWAFFHSSLAPAIQIGAQWPPMGILPFNPTLIPLLNTTILISSGITITWAHHSMINFKFNQTTKALFLTILLGMYFTILQGWEYYEAPFSISDSIYGSTFFVSTGFHGLHVIIGTIFLTVTLARMLMYHFSPYHHMGFEAAAWYWHFVDVVWLFLYSMIYWWGS